MRQDGANLLILLKLIAIFRRYQTMADWYLGSHGINRPGATSIAAHSRSRAAISPARPGSGRSQGAAIPAVPGHVPTFPRAQCRPAMRPRPTGKQLSGIQWKIELPRRIADCWHGIIGAGNDGTGRPGVRGFARACHDGSRSQQQLAAVRFCRSHLPPPFAWTSSAKSARPKKSAQPSAVALYLSSRMLGSAPASSKKRATSRAPLSMVMWRAV